jgi:very-short-patch-repair endonuclease
MTGRSHPLDLVPGLRELARAQRGVVRRDQLRALGVTRHHVRSQIEAQRWRAIGPRAVVLTTGVLTRSQSRAVAAAHAGPSATLAGLACLEELGLSGWERRGIEVLVPHGLKPTALRGVVVHQSHYLPAHELLADRWPPCTTAARAAVDAASWERDGRTACALVIAVVQQHLATAHEILLALERPGSVRHRALLRAAISEAADGADSHAEVDVARMLRALGLGPVQHQLVVDTPDGRFPVDLAVRLPDGRPLVIEVDGPHHDDPRQRERDAIKDAALIAAGHVVLRIPVTLLRRTSAVVRAQLRAIADAARATA